MTTYAGADSFPTSTTIPDDGGPRTAASVNVPLEAALDRTVWLKNRIAALTPIADLAALAAILAPADGTPRMVRALGWYIFQTSATGTGFGTEAIKATDGTVGTWIRVGYSRRFQGRSVNLQDFAVSANAAIVSPGSGPNSQMGPRDRNAAFIRSSVTYQFSSGVLYPRVWVDSTAGSLRLVAQPDTSGANKSYGLMWNLDRVLVDGCKILSLDVGLLPAPGRSALPSYIPMSIGIFRCPTYPSSGLAPSLTTLVSAGDFTNDDAATVVDYETFHHFYVLCNQYNVVDLAQYTYYAQVWNESGATNALANNQITSITLEIDNYTDAAYAAP